MWRERGSNRLEAAYPADSGEDAGEFGARSGFRALARQIRGILVPIGQWACRLRDGNSTILRSSGRVAAGMTL